MKTKFLVLVLLSTFCFADNNSDGLEAFKVGDYKKARELFAKSCEEGNPVGCGNIGVIYSDGKGVKADLSKSAKFFKKACDGGDPGGCNNLGVFYEDGTGVKKDYSLAKEYYKKACDGNYSMGCSLYNSMIKKGR